MTPTRFRFAVKMPRSITHESGLHGTRLEETCFFTEIEGLLPKLAVVLIQLPPGLEFSARTVRTFFHRLPQLPGTHMVCEPRHMSWFSKNVLFLLSGRSTEVAGSNGLRNRIARRLVYF